METININSQLSFPNSQLYALISESFFFSAAGAEQSSIFLATLVALHLTPVSKSLGRSFELA